MLVVRCVCRFCSWPSSVCSVDAVVCNAAFCDVNAGAAELVCPICPCSDCVSTCDRCDSSASFSGFTGIGGAGIEWCADDDDCDGLMLDSGMSNGESSRFGGGAGGGWGCGCGCGC